MRDERSEALREKAAFLGQVLSVLIPFFVAFLLLWCLQEQNFRACGAAEMGGALRARRQIGPPPSASTPVTFTHPSIPRGMCCIRGRGL